MIQGHTERLNSLGSDFKKHHFTIIELVDKDQETLEQEQALLDDHHDKTTNMMDHLIRLGYTKPSLTVVALSMSLETDTEPSRFYILESSLRSVNKAIEPLTSRAIRHFLRHPVVGAGGPGLGPPGVSSGQGSL